MHMQYDRHVQYMDIIPSLPFSHMHTGTDPWAGQTLLLSAHQLQEERAGTEGQQVT